MTSSFRHLSQSSYLDGDNHPVTRGVRHLAENWDQVSAAAADPAMLSLGALVGAATLGGGAAGVAGVSALVKNSRMRSIPSGAAFLGHAVTGFIGPRQPRSASRRGGTYQPGNTTKDFWAHRLFPRMAYIGYESRYYHMELVAPTGGGKTTALMNTAINDLRNKITVVVMEASGDLGASLIPYARALGVPSMRFDPLHPEGLPWNPLLGDPHLVAGMLASAFKNVSNTKEEFFQKFGADTLYHVINTVHAIARSRDTVPTLLLLDELLSDDLARDEGLGLSGDAKKRQSQRNGGAGGNGSKKGSGAGRGQKVMNPQIEETTRNWWQNHYYQWEPIMRRQFLAGLMADVDALVRNPAVRAALCPPANVPQIDMPSALDSGGLIVFRAAEDELGGSVTSAPVASLLQQYFQLYSRRRPDKIAYPVHAIYDEVHVLLGRNNESAAMDFSSYITQIRKKNVHVTIAHQSPGMLCPLLRQVIAGQCATKMFGAINEPEDLEYARAQLGYGRATIPTVMSPEHSIFETHRHERPRTGYSQSEEPLIDYSQLNLPRGRFWTRLYNEDRHLPPRMIHVPKPPPAAFYGNPEDRRAEPWYFGDDAREPKAA